MFCNAKGYDLNTIIRVAILVLLDYVLQLNKEFEKKIDERVAILVLLDYVLQFYNDKINGLKERKVAILVLLDYVLQYDF